MVTLACRVGPMPSDAQCHWIHSPSVHIHQNASNAAKKIRHNVQMDYSSGICTLVFKPDHSDLGEWTCKFTLANENADLEIGSATLVLLNTLADERLGWIVGALTAVILFLMIIVVVLVVCKARLFVRKPEHVLETIPAAQKKQDIRLSEDRYTQSSNKMNYRCTDQNDQNTANINHVLPNRSPHLYERGGKNNDKEPKTYENVKV